MNNKDFIKLNPFKLAVASAFFTLILASIGHILIFFKQIFSSVKFSSALLTLLKNVFLINIPIFLISLLGTWLFFWLIIKFCKSFTNKQEETPNSTKLEKKLILLDAFKLSLSKALTQLILLTIFLGTPFLIIIFSAKDFLQKNISFSIPQISNGKMAMYFFGIIFFIFLVSLLIGWLKFALTIKIYNARAKNSINDLDTKTKEEENTIKLKPIRLAFAYSIVKLITHVVPILIVLLALRFFPPAIIAAHPIFLTIVNFSLSLLIFLTILLLPTIIFLTSFLNSWIYLEIVFRTYNCLIKREEKKD